MGNLTLPTPVALAGGAICLLGGYLFGVLTGPDTGTLTTATVASFDDDSDRLCLAGDEVKGQDGLDEQGRLCGTWRRPDTSGTPRVGERFRFVTLHGGSTASDGDQPVTVIYGDVVR